MTEITYTHSTAGYDEGRYDLSRSGAFTDDQVATMGLDDLARLARSDDWEDRVRAEWLRDRLSITLPDQFPCIYETADSPNHEGLKYKRPYLWVVSADIEMLEKLLPVYQELWDSYTAQWGQKFRRTFAVGRLDGLSPRGAYRPGATPEQVLASTLLTHTGMYREAPEHLRRMHPQYDQWNRKS